MNLTNSNINTFLFHSNSLTPGTSLESNRIIKTKTKNLFNPDKSIVENFSYWLENKPIWYVLIKRNNCNGVAYYLRDWKYFRVYNRFDKPYVKYVIKKFKMFMYYAEEHSFVHIVLTVDRSMSIVDSIKELKKNWNRLRALIKKRLGKNYPYLCVLEPQKSGYPHLHILYFTDKFIIKQNELSDWCKSHNLGKIVFIKRYWVNFRKKPIFYLIKYLSKQYKKDKWSPVEFEFYAYLWFYKIKTYSSNWHMNIKIKKNWCLICIGTFEEIKVVIKQLVSLGCFSYEFPLEFYSKNFMEKLSWWYEDDAIK